MMKNTEFEEIWYKQTSFCC